MIKPCQIQVQELVKQMFKNKEPVKGINPDEAVAYGAAVQVLKSEMYNLNGVYNVQHIVYLGVQSCRTGIQCFPIPMYSYITHFSLNLY